MEFLLLRRDNRVVLLIWRFSVSLLFQGGLGKPESGCEVCITSGPSECALRNTGCHSRTKSVDSGKLNLGKQMFLLRSNAQTVLSSSLHIKTRYAPSSRAPHLIQMGALCLANSIKHDQITVAHHLVFPQFELYSGTPK